MILTIVVTESLEFMNWQILIEKSIIIGVFFFVSRNILDDDPRFWKQPFARMSEWYDHQGSCVSVFNRISLLSTGNTNDDLDMTSICHNFTLNDNPLWIYSDLFSNLPIWTCLRVFRMILIRCVFFPLLTGKGTPFPLNRTIKRKRWESLLFAFPPFVLCQLMMIIGLTWHLLS